MSETALARPKLAKYCEGVGLDLGFGGDAIVPTAITFDTDPPYAHVGGDKQIMKGDCRNLSMFCTESLDYLYQSHLAEDFEWQSLIQIVHEWRRVLKVGGYFVCCNPDEQVYRSVTPPEIYNQAHKNADFNLQTFKDRVISQTGPWEIVYECPLIDTYSFHLVAKKIA